MSRFALNRCYSRYLSRLKPLRTPLFFSSSAASNRDGEYQTGPPPIRVGLTESAGRAVFATRRIGAGDLIHTAKPVVAFPSLLKLDSVCYLCLKKLMGSAKLEDRGVSYCSQECQEKSKGFLDVERRADWSSFVEYCRTHNFKYPLMVKRLCCMIISGVLPACVLKSAPRPRLGSRLSEAKGSAPLIGEARRSPRGSRSGTPGLKARLNSLCASDRKSCASNGQGSEAPAPRLKAQTEHPSALPRLALFKTQLPADCLDILQPAALSAEMISKIEDGYGLLWNAFRKANFKDDDVSFLTKQWYTAILARIRINAFRIDLVGGSCGEDLLSLAAASVEGESAVGHAVYMLPSFYNHDCDPNAHIIWLQNADARLNTLRDVEEGEELRICYIDASMGYEARQTILSQGFGFLCNCLRCQSAD